MSRRSPSSSSAAPFALPLARPHRQVDPEQHRDPAVPGLHPLHVEQPLPRPSRLPGRFRLHDRRLRRRRELRRVLVLEEDTVRPLELALPGVVGHRTAHERADDPRLHGGPLGEADLGDELIPHDQNPPRGYVATANQDNVGVTADGDPCNDIAYIGGAFAQGYRQHRIRERLDALIAGGGGITTDAMIDLHAETRSSLGEGMRDAIVASRVSRVSGTAANSRLSRPRRLMRANASSQRAYELPIDGSSGPRTANACVVSLVLR